MQVVKNMQVVFYLLYFPHSSRDTCPDIFKHPTFKGGLSFRSFPFRYFNDYANYFLNDNALPVEIWWFPEV